MRYGLSLSIKIDRDMPNDKIAALVQRINSTSNADFVKRLLDPNRETLPAGNGKVMTHRMSYATDGRKAIVYPEVQNINRELVELNGRDALESAIEHRDTVMMSIPEAKRFTKHYKEYYPGFDKYGNGDGVGIKPGLLREFATGGAVDGDKNVDSGITLDNVDRHGNAVLEKYKGTEYDPLSYDGWATTLNGASRFLSKSNITEDTNPEVLQYFRSYVNSDGYNRIMRNEKDWWTARHPIRKFIPFHDGLSGATHLRQFINELDAPKVFNMSMYPEQSFYLPRNRTVYIGTYGDGRWPNSFVVGHEVAHGYNGGTAVNSDNGNNAIYEALQQNTNTEEGHDSYVDEKHSDIWGLKYLLYKEGIYDSRSKDDITPEQVQKLREKYPKLRPLQQMDNEKASWMLNHVALSKSKRYDTENIAAMGGRLSYGTGRAYGNGSGFIRKYADGGYTGGPDKQRSTEGGYTSSTESREYVNASYDPALGFDPISWMFSTNRSKGEENEYWRAYLGLENEVPKMNPAAKTAWDDKVEAEKTAAGKLPSDFYGTTPRMDQMIQVVADTLNTGKLLRNYDEYKKEVPDLADRRTIEHMYNDGKRVMENPGKWTQVTEGPQFMLYDRIDPQTNEIAPLGMLADFGMMWSPDEGALRVHDTYDFPFYVRALSRIPQRPREMKIRGLVKFDPNRGSVLLRDGLDESKVEPSIATYYSR